MKIIRNIIGILMALMIIMPVSAIDTYENDTHDSGANILADEHNHESDEDIEDVPDSCEHVPTLGLWCTGQQCVICRIPLYYQHSLIDRIISAPPSVCYQLVTECFKCPYSLILDSGMPCNVRPKRNIVGTRQICYVDGEGCIVCSYFKPTGSMVISHTFPGGILSACTICGYKQGT